MIKNKKLQGFYVGATIFTLLGSSSLAYAISESPYPADDRVYQHLNVLASVDNARTSGTEGEKNAANYILNEFEKYGLVTDVQKFPLVTFEDHGSKLTIDSEQSKTLETKAFTYSAATPKEGLNTEIVYSNLGSEEDFSKIDVKGKIALIKRGSLTFGEKVTNAAKAGAIGAIIFNKEAGMISGTLGAPSTIPVVALTDVDGEYLKALTEKGQPVKISMTSDTKIKNGESQNVIGTLYAAHNAKTAKTVVVGAHMDCVDTPGANDNASGTVGLLELASACKDINQNYNIKFVSFGAEETGLNGSQHFVESLSQEEKDNIACMINMDMTGVGDTLGVFTAEKESNPYMADLAEKNVKNLGYNYSRSVENRSDHASFDGVGIPAVHFDYHEDKNYHTDNDTIDKIDSMNVLNVYSVVLNMLRDLNTQMPTVEKEKPQVRSALNSDSTNSALTNSILEVE